MEIQQLLKDIKQKKELSGIADSLVLERILNYLEKNRVILNDLNPSQLKLVIKDIRAGLRENVGRFKVGTRNRAKLQHEKDIDAILCTHSSTKERVSFYPQLREIIKKINASSILDLGCGINPLALAQKGIKYYASDINQEDLDIVKRFFLDYDIDGETFVCDLNKIEECILPKADLTLVLKVFDILGKNDYKTAEKIIEKIQSKNLIISFSTRTLSGKPMKNQRRIWLEKLLNSVSYKFEIVKSDNEIFYII